MNIRSSIFPVALTALLTEACGGVLFGTTKVPYADACGTAADNKCKVFSRLPPPLVLTTKRTIVPVAEQKEQWEIFLGGVYLKSDRGGQVPALCADVALLSAANAEVTNVNPFTFDITSGDLIDANLSAGLAASLLDDAGQSTTPEESARDSKQFGAKFDASLKASGSRKVRLAGTYMEVAIPAVVQQELLKFEPANIQNAAAKKCRLWLDQHAEYRLIANLSAFRIDSFQLEDKSAFQTAFNAGVAAVVSSDKQAKLKARFEASIDSTGTVHLANPVTGIYSFGFMGQGT
jgi:hypothetical protein